MDEAGRVRGIFIGTTTVQATVGALTATTAVRVIGKPVGSWVGEFVVRRCVVTEQFHPSWCGDGSYAVGTREYFALVLVDADGRIGGSVSITRPNCCWSERLDVDLGSSLDSDGHLQLSARGDPWGGWYGDVLAIIDPLNAHIRGDAVEGSFVLTVISTGNAVRGSAVIEADLENVRLR